MKIKMSNPLISWAVWSIFFGVLFILVMHQFLLASIRADKSGISIGIVLLFMTGWLISFLHARRLARDWNALNPIQENLAKMESGHEAGIIKLLHKIQTRHDQGLSVSFDNVVSSYRMRVDGPRRIVVSFSSILITIGLIGTILGLIHSMAGLNDIMMSVTTSRESLISGLQTTLSGMGTAFYSTLYGAIFGGVMLRLLANNALSSESSICGAALEYLELHLGNPLTLSRESRESVDLDHAALEKEHAQLLNSIKTAQLEIMSFTSTINKQTEDLSQSIGTINQELKAFSTTMIDSRLEQVASHLQDVAQTMKSLGK